MRSEQIVEITRLALSEEIPIIEKEPLNPSEPYDHQQRDSFDSRERRERQTVAPAGPCIANRLKRDGHGTVRFFV